MSAQPAPPLPPRRPHSLAAATGTHQRHPLNTYVHAVWPSCVPPSRFDNSYFKDIKEQIDEELLVLPTDACLFEDEGFK